MKRIIAAGMISLMAFSATAGNVTYEPPVVIEIEEPTTMGGSGAWLIPLAIIAVLVLSISQQGPQPSDSRLKTDITPIGVAENGLTLYSFRYIGSTQVFSGVMAQDVLMHTPDAVHVGPFGYMAVDYGMLGLEMQRLN